MIETKTNFEQINKMEKKTLVRFFALAVPLVSAIVVMTLSSQAVYAQITPAQQQALKSLVATGYTNSYPINPPRTWCSGGPPGCPNVSIKYSITLGQLIAMVPDQPRTSLDVVLAPTQHATSYGLLTMQIPRWALDSKNPSGTDTPFRVRWMVMVFPGHKFNRPILIEYLDFTLVLIMAFYKSLETLVL